MSRTAHRLAAVLLQWHQTLLTNECLKETRRERVLVDWMRSVVAASPKGRPGRHADHLGRAERHRPRRLHDR